MKYVRKCEVCYTIMWYISIMKQAAKLVVCFVLLKTQERRWYNDCQKSNNLTVKPGQLRPVFFMS